MALKLDLGSIGNMELSSDGDLSKYLQSNADGIIKLDSKLEGILDLPVSKVPTGSACTSFNFSSTPSWKITQTVGINLSIKPEASCKVSIIPPGGPIFTYYTGEDGQKNSVVAPKDVYYVGIEMESSLSIDAGATYSSGDFGVSADVAMGDQFRLANYYGVGASVTLRDAISQAFSHFALPFHADSIANLPSGDYLDFEFVGNLSLGFGATFGFSKMFFGGVSKGEVCASFATPIGKQVMKAAPAFQVGAGFKINYADKDDFRVVVGRTDTGATLYLLRPDVDKLTATETFGITLSTGAKFSTDTSTLKSETQTAAQGMFGSTAGTLLCNKMSGLLDRAAKDINDSVNDLLKGDGKSIELKLVQSRSKENTALFIYDFDFSRGTGAYGIAMKGDYAKALSMPGVRLDPRSFVEQVYTRSAGLSLQFFNLAASIQDITTYIQENQVSYLGSGVFQIRSSAEKQSIGRIFGKEREADLYFIAECQNLSQSISDITVRLNAVFIDTNDASAYGESQRVAQALGLANIAQSMQAHVGRYPKKPVKLTLDIDTASLGLVDADDYIKNKPPAEPHLKDKRNYEEFVRSVVKVVGPVDTIATTFEKSFSNYADWLAFNRAVTDTPDSSNPGDREHTGDTNGDNWPTNYPPADKALRIAVQSYILAGQEFMNFCAAIKKLLVVVPGTATVAAYDKLFQSISNMVRDDESVFPTWFLKPSIVALVNSAGIRLEVDGDLPDATKADCFNISLKSTAVKTALAAAA